MDWAARRRFVYLAGLFLFFALLFSYPAYRLLHRAPTCSDGIFNGDETDVDKGGSCPILDERALAPVSVRWARAFKTSGNLYNAVAYIENPNDGAGVVTAPYQFKFYDSSNVLVAVRSGTTVIMPGSVTPVFEGRIEVRDNEIARAFFDLGAGLTYVRLSDMARHVDVSDRETTDTDTMPRISATVADTDVRSILAPSFVAIVFDTAGNAFAVSQTALDRLDPGKPQRITFTWPTPWKYVVGRIDILPIITPLSR